MTEENTEDFDFRIFVMKEGFTFSQLNDRDIDYYRRVNKFDDDEKLVVFENGEMVYCG